MCALRASLVQRGRMPTEKELLADVGMHRGTLQRILYRLTEKGELIRLPNGTLRFELPNSRVTPSPASAEREKAAPAGLLSGAATFSESAQ
jgi:hypothetical protein